MFFFNQAVSKSVIAFAVAILLLLGPVRIYAMESREVGVVAVDRLNLRSGPGLNASVIDVLPKGTQVRIIQDVKHWLKVLADGNIGYVYDDDRYLKRYVIHTVVKGKNDELEMARARARQVEQQLSENKEKVAGITKKENQVLNDLDRIDRKFSDTRSHLQDVRAEMATVNDRLDDIQKKAEKTQKSIDARKTYAQSRIVALYKLNRLGAMNLLASAKSLDTFFRRKAAVQKVVEYDERVIGGLVNEKNRLAGLLHRMNAEKERKQSLEKDYQSTLRRLTQIKKEKEALLAKIKSEKSSRMARIRYLQAAAVRLEKTISVLHQGSYHATKAFSAYRGLLKMPVQGRIIFKFGKYVEPDSGVLNIHNGIEIQSRRGAPVRAVFYGKTLYADWLKGYGKVIIIAHGNGYYTVYAHVDEMFCKKGETVKTGEVIATVGDTGAIDGGPGLYFEIRHHGNPVDPLKWIDNG